MQYDTPRYQTSLDVKHQAIVSADVESLVEEVTKSTSGACDTVDLFGMKITSATLAEVFKAFDDQIAARKFGYAVTPNVDHICKFQDDSQLRAAYRDAFLVLPDSMPLMWASRLCGKPIREKICGSDMIFWLTDHARKKGYKVFLLGADEGIAAEAAVRLRERYPGVNIVGTLSPPKGFEKDPERNAEVIRVLREAAPDICFVALGCPKQDIWAWKHVQECEIPVMLGIGAAVDFAAGRVKRAPQFFQRVGLEWFWRLCCEPTRLWKRYLVDDMRFFVLVWRELRKGRSRTYRRLR